MEKKENLILIGFMGSGKTTLGIRLSYRLRQTFVDTDKWIEKQQGKSISSIFAEEGEEAFRRLETECLKKLQQESGKQIISTGGGMPLRAENRVLLKQLGTVVYLKASPDAIYERLKEDTTRPLLQTKDPRQRIKELLGDREAAYQEAADQVMNTEGKSQEEVLDELLRLLDKGEKKQ